MSTWLIVLNVVVLSLFLVATGARLYYAKIHRKIIKDTDAFVQKLGEERLKEVQMIETMLQTQALYFAMFVAVLAKTYKGQVINDGDEMHVYIPLPTGILGYVVHQDYMQYFLDLPTLEVGFEKPYPIEQTLVTIDRFLKVCPYEEVKSFIAQIDP